MKTKIVLALLLPVLVVALVGAAPLNTPDADVEPVGGSRYWFCAAFQFVKYAGLVTGRPDAVLVGAIGSGLACAYGW